MFLGLRGVGAVQGGVETHVTNLVRNLPYALDEIEVIGRAPYRGDSGPHDPTLPRTRWLPTLRHPHAEAIVHSVLGVFYAALRRPDVLHIHAVGPGIVTPLARLLGIRVVVTHHGEDYKREKWGPFARSVLRLAEKLSIGWSHASITISPVLADVLSERYGREVRFIPNGVPAIPRVGAGETLKRFGLTPGRYILNVARVVPEKRQLDLIEAFAAAAVPDARLLLVGSADHGSDYAKEVNRRAAQVPGVILAGQISGEPLAELFTNARLFALPSSHEGLPIALLEAMQFGLPVLVSDLPVYRHIGIPGEAIVPVADVAAIASAFRKVLSDDAALRHDLTAMLNDYRWPAIGHQTADIYAGVIAA
ncbi:glycosyltransferase family 4 protein [Novosphingobium rosa]|uniref:glycosyltransferase family 4 protein n=1 Tax=Novosphingobium rosa TaxID=76978 RepID=UPI0008376311|nr:glycosyltransferase family 4 protein [Novosphingobium rosa]